MSYDQIIALCSIAATVFVGIASVWLNHFLASRKKTSIEHCEMVEKLVGGDGSKTTHDLLLETRFRSLYKRQTEASVIRFLLSLPYPLLRIIQYKIGRKYLEKRTNDAGKVTGFDLIPRIRNQTKRKRIYWGLMLVYAGLIFATMYPLIMYKAQIEAFVAEAGYQLFFPLGTLVLCAFGIAFMALAETAYIDNAVKLVDALKQENTHDKTVTDRDEKH